MITVRFPSGFSIQYNSLNHADIRDNGIYLSTKDKPNSYSVWVPRDCVIEHISPCRTYNAMTDRSLEGIQRTVESLGKEIRSLKRKLAKDGRAK